VDWHIVSFKELLRFHCISIGKLLSEELDEIINLVVDGLPLSELLGLNQCLKLLVKNVVLKEEHILHELFLNPLLIIHK